MKLTRAEIKIKLINEGFEVIPSWYRKKTSDRTMSFTLPYPHMNRLRKILDRYTRKRTGFEDIVNMFNIKKLKKRRKILHMSDINLDIKEYTHEDYKFYSVGVTKEIYDKINNIAKTYGISRSSVIRLIVENCGE